PREPRRDFGLFSEARHCRDRYVLSTSPSYAPTLLCFRSATGDVQIERRGLPATGVVRSADCQKGDTGGWQDDRSGGRRHTRELWDPIVRPQLQILSVQLPASVLHV